jgi:hypothetical protein
MSRDFQSPGNSYPELTLTRLTLKKLCVYIPDSSISAQHSIDFCAAPKAWQNPNHLTGNTLIDLKIQW